MRRAAMIACLCCLPACKQIDELPPATPGNAAAPAATSAPDDKPPAWLSSEASVFEHVQQTLEQAGFPEVRTAVFRVTEDVALPAYQGADRTLSIPPFADGAEAMRARLARTSARHFAGAFTFIDAYPSLEQAYTGYRVFLTIAVAHELAHHLQLVQKPAAPPSDIYALESSAIELEQAFLAHEIEAKHVPATWRDHYRRAVMAVRDSVPLTVRDKLPEDEKARSLAFAQAYATYARGEAASRDDGVNPEVDAAALVYAGYTEKRVSLLVKPGRPLSSLAKAFRDRATGP